MLENLLLAKTYFLVFTMVFNYLFKEKKLLFFKITNLPLGKKKSRFIRKNTRIPLITQR